MLRISKLTDYAIVITLFIGQQEHKYSNATLIATKTKLGLATVKKVLRQLMVANIVKSEQGATGGYSLIKLTSNITMRDIIHAMEGNIALTECSQNKSTCDKNSTCQISQHWQVINQIILSALDKVSLNDLTQSPKDWQPITFERNTSNVEK